MRKFFAFALAAAAAIGVQAQDAKTLYNQAKKLDDEFNKSKPTQMSPNKEVTPDVALGLLNALEMYDQVLVLDQQPNEKGQVKPKFTKKIEDSMKKHSQDNDFNVAASVLFNADKKYPEAYKAFMISGQTSQKLQTVPDTVYAIDFLNAGNCAYGKDFKAAAAAYSAARKANINDVNAYIYDIGSRQNLAQQDAEYAKQAPADIHEIAKKGLQRFGAGQDFLLSNYMQYFIDNDKIDEAIKMLEQLQAQEPENANIYRLRGIICNANNKYAEAIPAFLTMAKYTDRFDYLYKAADDLNRIGKLMMGNLGNKVTPEQKAQVMEIFNSANEIANKAKTAEGADASAEDLIDQIQYSIENAQKL